MLRGYSGFMVQLGIDIVDYYAGWPTKMHGSIPASPHWDLAVRVLRGPIGVVGVIMPWNGRSAVPLGVVPALACGNSVVLKPSEETPLTAVLLARPRLIGAGVPQAYSMSSMEQARWQVRPWWNTSKVDAISFTGSVETGRRVQVAAAARLRRSRSSSEAKAHSSVFADADLEAAVATCTAAVWGHSEKLSRRHRCSGGTLHSRCIRKSPGGGFPGPADRLGFRPGKPMAHRFRRSNSIASVVTWTLAAMKEPGWYSVGRDLGAGGTSTSRRSLLVCITTCVSPAKRFSAR